MFSVHNTFSYFMNMHSMKNRDIWRKICILCPAFPISWDICEKNSYYVLLFLSAGTYAKKSSYYVPYKCHNRTFVASSRPYVPFDFYRRTFLLSFCPYVPYRCLSRTFSTPFRPYVPFVLHQGIFLPFFLLADFLHRGAVTTNIDKLNRRQKSSAACYITYAVTLIKLLFPKNAECPEMKKKQQLPLQYPVLFLSQYNQSHQFLPVLPHEYRLKNPQLQQPHLFQPAITVSPLSTHPDRAFFFRTYPHIQ